MKTTDLIDPNNYRVADLVGLGTVEHMNTAELDNYIVIKWNDQWYKIPFFVIDDIRVEWEKKQRGKSNKLLNWYLGHYWKPWNEKGLAEIKEILAEEMPALSAYIIDQDKI